MAERTTKRHEKLLLGTISVRLTDRSFVDFVRTGANSNYLPDLHHRLAALQARLDDFGDIDLGRPSDDLFASLDGKVILSEFSVMELSYSEGSVWAKIQVGCVVVFTAFQGFAAYPDAKVGFAEARDDLVQIAQEVFGNLAENTPPDQGEPDSVQFYFLRPERVAERIQKLDERKLKENDNDQQDNVGLEQ